MQNSESFSGLLLHYFSSRFISNVTFGASVNFLLPNLIRSWLTEENVYQNVRIPPSKPVIRMGNL